jgi:hypothetical protein
MTNLSPTDLKFIFLGIMRNGKFDEKTIANSELAKLGVGRILDQLASLKERNLILMNKDGSFSITDIARNTLWELKTPIEIRILKILEISPQTLENIAALLQISEEIIQKKIKELQWNHLVLMTTIKNDIGIVRSYEILPEGLEYLEKSNSGKTQSFHSNSKGENIRILQNIIEEIQNFKEISNDSKNKIISDLNKVKQSLEK